MAKSKKVSKKAQVEAPVEVAPVEVAPAPVPVEAVAPVEAQPVKGKRGRKPRAERAAETPEVKWTRRLKRWQAKAEAQGVDTRALMEGALAG